MKTVLITGASDGIGKEVAKLLDSKGYSLYLFGRTKEKLDKLCEELTNVKKAYSFDMLDHETLLKNLKDINDNGGVDVLVNNAGANFKKQEVKDIDIDIFNSTMDLNCTTHLMCIQAVLPKMFKQKKGNIINILSSCCKFTNLTSSAYTASKKAMEAISKALAKEVKDQGVIVTGIYPGGVNTNFRTLDRPDYLLPETVAKQVLYVIENDDGLIQEIVLRPVVENNY